MHYLKCDPRTVSFCLALVLVPKTLLLVVTAQTGS